MESPLQVSSPVCILELWEHHPSPVYLLTLHHPHRAYLFLLIKIYTEFMFETFHVHSLWIALCADVYIIYHLVFLVHSLSGIRHQQNVCLVSVTVIDAEHTNETLSFPWELPVQWTTVRWGDEVHAWEPLAGRHLILAGLWLESLWK